MHDLSITQDRLKELLYYNKQFGIFVRRKTASTRVKVGDIAGSIDGHGHIKIKVDGVRFMAHRLAFLFVNGLLPSKHVDHINGVRGDNSWKNLREVTQQENNKNKKIYKSNSSGVIGVCWGKKESKWKSRIDIGGAEIGLYYGDDFFEACCRRKSAELKYNFHPNHGRR